MEEIEVRMGEMSKSRAFGGTGGTMKLPQQGAMVLALLVEHHNQMPHDLVVLNLLCCYRNQAKMEEIVTVSLNPHTCV